MPINEATKTTLFLKYAKHFFNFSFAFEAKICKEPSIPFDAVKPHQIASLYQVKHGTFNYKISDNSYSPLPYDGFQFVTQPAFVIIFWAQKHGDKRFTMIDIDDFILETKTAPRRSLTFERASEIGKSYEF